jgi:hypothetical protein
MATKLVDFMFERNDSGNYQTTVSCNNPGNKFTVTRLTVQRFQGKVYVDLRDFRTNSMFAKPSDYYPTKVGVTLAKAEWQKLCGMATQVVVDLKRISEELDRKQAPVLPIYHEVTEDLALTLQLDSKQLSAVQVLVAKQVRNWQGYLRKPMPREICLRPLAWINVFERNQEQINNLLHLLEKEDFFAATKAEETAIAADQALFMATTSLPTTTEHAAAMQQ